MANPTRLLQGGVSVPPELAETFEQWSQAMRSYDRDMDARLAAMKLDAAATQELYRTALENLDHKMAKLHKERSDPIENTFEGSARYAVILKAFDDGTLTTNSIQLLQQELHTLARDVTLQKRRIQSLQTLHLERLAQENANAQALLDNLPKDTALAVRVERRATLIALRDQYKESQRLLEEARGELITTEAKYRALSSRLELERDAELNRHMIAIANDVIRVVDRDITATKKSGSKLVDLSKEVQQLKDVASKLEQEYKTGRDMVIQRVSDAMHDLRVFEDALAVRRRQLKTRSIRGGDFPDPSTTVDYTARLAELFPLDEYSLPAVPVPSTISESTAVASLRDPSLPTCSTIGSGAGFSVTPYQEMTGVLMGPATPNKGLLSTLGVGAGKTGAAMRAVLQHWTYRNDEADQRAHIHYILVLLPQRNLFGQWENQLRLFAKAYPGLENLDGTLARQIGPDTRMLSLPYTSGGGGSSDSLKIILHRMTVQLPSTVVRMFEQAGSSMPNYLPPDDDLVIVDEAQNLPAPWRLPRINPTGQDRALGFAEALLTTDRPKRLLLTGSPVANPQRTVDFAKLGNMCRRLNDPMGRLPHGRLRRAVAQDAPVAQRTQRQREDAADERELIDMFFDSKGEWLPGKRRDFQLMHVGLVSYVTLSFDSTVYPQLDASPNDGEGSIFRCGDTNTPCDVLFVKSSDGGYELAPAAARLPLTESEKMFRDSQDLKHVRTIHIGVPLTAPALKNYESKEPAALAPERRRLLGCDDPDTCVDFTANDNPLAVDRSLALKSFAGGGKSDKKKRVVANKLLALSWMLSHYATEKHFVYTGAGSRFQGPEDAYTYFVDTVGYEALTPSSVIELARRVTAGTLTVAEAVSEWYGLHPLPARRFVFFSLSSKDRQTSDYTKGTFDRAMEILAAIYNDRERNRTAAHVHFFFGDRSVKEGITLLDTRHGHLMNPTADREQAIGRILRFCAFQEPARVRIYTYISNKPERTSSTKKQQQRSLLPVTADEIVARQIGKAAVADLMLAAVREAAIDCLYFKEYNHVSTCFVDDRPAQQKTEEDPQQQQQQLVCFDPSDPSKSVIGLDQIGQILKERGMPHTRTNGMADCNSLGWIAIDHGMDTWNLHHEILLQLLKKLPKEALGPVVAPITEQEDLVAVVAAVEEEPPSTKSWWRRFVPDWMQNFPAFLWNAQSVVDASKAAPTDDDDDAGVDGNIGTSTFAKRLSRLLSGGAQTSAKTADALTLNARLQLELTKAERGHVVWILEQWRRQVAASSSKGKQQQQLPVLSKTASAIIELQMQFTVEARQELMVAARDAMQKLPTEDETLRDRYFSYASGVALRRAAAARSYEDMPRRRVQLAVLRWPQKRWK